jgi:hypothetical protein
MIPNETPQSIETVGQGVKVVGNFRITDANQARILVSLSDKMYTRKELAFVREYSTNAADAHIVAKRPIGEIIVELPTLENLNFRLRDFGSGLTEDQISTVYCVFGESTKRNSNEQNGLLGYGCKAGFAHADSFTVTSWINGEKSIYQCVKGDSTKLHSAILLSRAPSDGPTGIEITIPVKQTAIWTVHREASNFYKHWPELPTILNMADSDKERMDRFRNNPPTLKGEGWEIRPKSDSNAMGVVYMGWVAYTIDWNVLFNRMSLTSQKRVLFELLQSNDVTLFFKMGEVQFVDSREQLEYTELTLSAMIKRIENIFDKIKDSIQSKFDPAPNIWEAKKTYNAIFGTGIVEVESGEDEGCETIERIKILDGNLMRLETSLKGVFTWNGIKLHDARFSNINRFDNACSTEVKDDHHDPITPIMVTYRKKKKRAKLSRCSSEKNNNVVASDAVAVVLNDTGLKSGHSIVARYLIFRNNSRVKTVHIFTFSDDIIKESFYKETDFSTVPMMNLSEILADAKTWNSANKVSRNYGGGGGGGRPMQYMDLETGKLEEVEIPMRELEDGGFYIELGTGRVGSHMVIGANGSSYHKPCDTIKNIKVFVEKTGIDMDRVYMIPPKTRDSKWFIEAKASGEWVNVWTLIKENLSNIGIDPVTLVNSKNYAICPIISKDVEKELTPLIKDKNSYILKVMTIVNSMRCQKNSEIIAALESFDLLDNIIGSTKGTVDLEEEKRKMFMQYPLLVHYRYSFESYSFGRSEAKEVAKYINAMDVYVEFYGDESTKIEKSTTT